MLLWLVLISVAGLAAVVATLYWTPVAWIRSYVQHFTAGLVIAVIALEVMPDIVSKTTNPWLTLGGFALGGLVLMLVKWLTERQNDTSASSGAVRGLVVASALDNIVDGLTLGAAFVSGGRLGQVLAITLGLEVVFLSLSVGGTMRARHTSRLRTAFLNGGLVLLVAAGCVSGYFALRGASEELIAATLAFGAAALVYLVSEELLVEAHQADELASAPGLLFLGFVAVFAFHLLGRGGA